MNICYANRVSLLIPIRGLHKCLTSENPKSVKTGEAGIKREGIHYGGQLKQLGAAALRL